MNITDPTKAHDININDILIDNAHAIHEKIPVNNSATIGYYLRCALFYRISFLTATSIYSILYVCPVYFNQMTRMKRRHYNERYPTYVSNTFEIINFTLFSIVYRFQRMLFLLFFPFQFRYAGKW